LDKFGRTYELIIDPDEDDLIKIGLPFTIEFDIIRNTMSSANDCQLRIYNLSVNTRNKIRWNAYDYSNFKAIYFRAGYGINPPVIFAGNISSAWSYREGVNFITQIECFDGGFAFSNGKTNTNFPSGTKQRDIIIALGKTLPHTSIGHIGDYTGELGRGASYNGNTTQILTDLTGGGFFIDNGKVNALKNEEYIESENGITIINAKSGLLGTPQLENNVARFDMLFEPTLHTGQLAKLKSATENNFNGTYKIIGVKHRGMISGAVCGEVVTTGEFFFSKSYKSASNG
jgi:hypothetical protein